MLLVLWQKAMLLLLDPPRWGFAVIGGHARCDLGTVDPITRAERVILCSVVHCLPSVVPAHAATKSNASRQRTTRPVEGEGKCAVHMRVEVSQKRPNSSRREAPACCES